MEGVVALVEAMMMMSPREGEAAAMIVLRRVCDWLTEGYNALF
jgi:hypothetical protein